MKQLLYRNRYFLLPQLLFLAVGSILLVLYSKPELHILINNYHNEWFDSFFRFITNLGNGFIYLPVILILFHKKVKWSLIYALSLLYSNLTLLIFKQFILDNSYRPAWYFQVFENYQLHLVDGVQLHQLNSFPSGHTTTAFTVFFMLAIMSRYKISQVILFALALITAFSRVYLSQHFFGDIVAGSILGTGTVLLAYLVITCKEKAWMQIKLYKYFVPKKKKETAYSKEI